MSLTEMSFPMRKTPDRVVAVYDDGYLRIEHDNYYVACDNHQIKLPRTEFLILSRLARTPERVVPAEELWEYAWGSSKRLNTESLHVYIYRLRAKLGIYDLKIDTMVNVGYRLLLAHPTKTQS
jgi:two-component system alkaline phosphatase synthesis response regulator PhoP